MLSVSRLFLDNIPHIKTHWIMNTAKVSQIALHFGVDDLEGTVRRERIYHDAGATTSQSLRRSELLRLIREARETLERLRGEGIDAELHVVGKKGIAYFRFRGEKIFTQRTDIGDQPTVEDAESLVGPIRDRFEAGVLVTNSTGGTRIYRNQIAAANISGSLTGAYHIELPVSVNVAANQAPATRCRLRRRSSESVEATRSENRRW